MSKFREDRQHGASDEGADFSSARLIEIIAAHCAFKAQIVAGDEREDLRRVDHRSRKILNFGHTVGHALEKVTSYKTLSAWGSGGVAACWQPASYHWH
ncbi:MAG: hypothetical protein WKF84_21020 [Pyrinomonadaceae bacterium]